MRRAKTRTKTLDIFKRMPILKREDQLPTDAEVVDSAVIKVGKVDLPVPDVSRVEDYETHAKGGYKPPRSYIRHKSGTQIVAGATEYEADNEDEMWLKSHAKFGEASDSATRLSLDLFERVIDVLEQEAGRRKHVPPLAQAEVVVADRTGLHRSGANSTLDDIYGYWKRKRERLKKPLLRRFWPPTQEGNTDPHATFRQRSKERYRLRRTRRSDDNDAYRRLAWIRYGLSRAIELLSLVQRREQAKLELVTIAADSFEQAVFEETDTTGVQRRPQVLKNRRFEHRAASDAATRHRSRQRKGKRRESRQASAASAAARALYEATMLHHIPAKHAERIASLHGLTSAQAAMHGEQATVGKVAVPFRTGPWRAPFFVPVHPAAGLAFTKWPLAPTAGDPDAARVKFAEGELEDVTGAAMLLAATRDGAAAACSVDTLHAHSGASARPVPHALSVQAAEFGARRSVSHLRDRGASAPMGVGGTGAGEAAGDVLGLGAASGLPAGFERDETLLRMQRLGHRTYGDADVWLQQRRASLHVDTTARLRALMLQHRTSNVKPTLGMATPGSAWEEDAGMALGVGSLGDHGEGWELTGHKPQIRAPDLLEAVEWRLGAVAATAAVKARKAAEAASASASGAAPAQAEGIQPLVRLTARNRGGSSSSSSSSRDEDEDEDDDDDDRDKGTPSVGGESTPLTAAWDEDEEDALFEEMQQLQSAPASSQTGTDGSSARSRGSSSARAQPSASAVTADALDGRATPTGSVRTGVLARTRHAAHAALDAEAAQALLDGTHPAEPGAYAPAPYMSRARVGRGGRVWVDRVRAPVGTDLGARRRAGMPDLAARDALHSRTEAEAAAAGGAAAVSQAALRTAGYVAPQTGQLASAVWHSSTRARSREDQEEAQGLASGLEAQDPGALHASLALALGPTSSDHGVASASVGRAGESSASASWQVRTRLLEEQSAALVGGGASAVVGRVPRSGGEAIAASLPGSGALAGQHGRMGAKAVSRLAGRAGIQARISSSSSSSSSSSASQSGQRVSGAAGFGSSLLRSADQTSVTAHTAALGKTTAVDPQGWPWLQSVLDEVEDAPHLAVGSVGSHSGLLAQRLGAPTALQHSKPPRARRLDQVYFAPDNAFGLLVEANDASRAEATHTSGTACPGGKGAQIAAPAVLLRGHGHTRPSPPAPVKQEKTDKAAIAQELQSLPAVEVTGPGSGTGDALDEAYWAGAVRAPRPITVLDTTSLLAKAASDTS